MLQFKHPSLVDEFRQLKTKYPPLAALMQDLTAFVQSAFSKDVMVTMIFRTQAQQEAIYGAGTKRKSPHMFWNAVDIRDWIYSEPEKAAITQWLKEGYDSANQLNYIHAARSRTVWLHEVNSHGMHFHIQYRGPMVYNFSEAMVITA